MTHQNEQKVTISLPSSLIEAIDKSIEGTTFSREQVIADLVIRGTQPQTQRQKNQNAAEVLGELFGS